MANEVFISYSRKDFTIVDVVKKEIDSSVGIDCWMDLNGIESGEYFKKVIISAINRHETLLFMLTPNSMASDFALKELNFAIKKKKRVILVDLAHTQLNDDFLFDYSDKDNIDWNDPLQHKKLIENLKIWYPNDINNHERADLQKSAANQEGNVPVSIDSVHELVALGAKLGSDGVPEKMQEQFVNDLVKTKRLATAQNNLGFHLSDTEKRIKYLEEAAQNGSGAALINLAHIYEYGEGVERDIDKAIDCYRSAIVHHGHTEFVDDIRALIKEKESKAKEAKS